MPAPRHTVFAIMATTAAIACGTPLMRSRADDKAEAATPDVLRKTRLDKVHALEELLKGERDEIDRQHDRNGVDELDIKVAETTARAAYEKAKLARQEAEVAMDEYKHGVFKQDMEGALADIQLAKMDLQRSRDRAEASKHVYQRLAIEKAEDTLEQANFRHYLLDRCDKVTKVGELQANIDQAKAVEAAKQEQIAMERDRLEAKHKHIAEYRTLVPEDLVMLLWDDAIACERRAVALTGESEEFSRTAGGDPKAAERRDAKRKDAAKEHTESRRLLIECFGVAKHVALSWTRIHDAEDEVRFARQAMLRGQPAPRPASGGNPSAKSQEEAIEVALRNRRDRVRTLEDQFRLRREDLRRRHDDIRVEAKDSLT